MTQTGVLPKTVKTKPSNPSKTVKPVKTRQKPSNPSKTVKKPKNPQSKHATLAHATLIRARQIVPGTTQVLRKGGMSAQDRPEASGTQENQAAG